jgi:hypothetical protein
MARVRSIDDMIRAAGHTAPTQTPVPLPSDNLSSDRNYFDVTISSVEYHDDRERRKFKKLEFKGMLLKFKSIVSQEDLRRKTSNVFASYILGGQKENKKIWELYIEIPEISGILPQPSFDEVIKYKNESSLSESERLTKEQKLKYENQVDRMPKFYCVQDAQPEITDIWKVRYHDENFWYYGEALDRIGQITTPVQGS